ncbi:MAG: hypothetical protein ACRCXZ_04180 [Patescibacteria group bacterium]
MWQHLGFESFRQYFVEYVARPRRNNRMFSHEAVPFHDTIGRYLQKAISVRPRRDATPYKVGLVADLGPLNKDYDDLALLMTLIGMHSQGIVQLDFVICNYYQKTGVQFANLISAMSNLGIKVIQGSYLCSENIPYQKDFPQALLLDDEYVTNNTAAAYGEIRQMVKESEGTILICSTALTELCDLIKVLDQESVSTPKGSLLKKVEVHIQNMASVVGDQLVIDLDPATMGANSKYDTVAAAEFARLANDLRFPVVVTTKFLAQQTKPKKGFYDEIKDLNVISDYFYTFRKECVQMWWETARGHDDDIAGSKNGMTREMMFNFIFSEVMSAEEFAKHTRFDDMRQYVINEPMVYDAMTGLLSCYPNLFEIEWDSTGTFGIAGARKGHGLLNYDVTMALFKAAILTGFMQIPANFNNALEEFRQEVYQQ